MASESFEATDSSGRTVRGGVEVSRDPKGAFYDPESIYYRNPRFAEFHIVYSNTRDVCEIDPDVLSRAVQKALHDALEKFGIPGPDTAAIEEDVNRRIDETRRRCIANVDKYVTNETGAATDLILGRSAGYGVAAGQSGGMREPAAAEDAWRAFEKEGHLLSNLRPVLDDRADTAERQPARYLSSAVAGKSVSSGGGTGNLAPPLAPFDQNFDPQQVEIDRPFGSLGASNAAVPLRALSEREPLLGLVSGKPMSFHSVQPTIWDFPERYAPSTEADDWLERLLQKLRTA